MAFSKSTTVLFTLAVILVLAQPAYCFGAGNIASLAKIEGINWRHGDIEDTLLSIYMSRAAGGKKFDKMMVARVYFGNWLRDYSQAIDVGTVKYVSAEAIRILLWVLGFMTFGYGTKEFEVTSERLGCYRPEDHIDNPKDYADNLDATEYDPRLRGPVDESVELAIDPEKGLKNYIASEGLGIMTSAEHVRKLFSECIRLGRSYAHTRNKAELYEALRLLGTGCHCLEDFSAHSNYTELALIEMGERDVFPFVGRNTKMRLPGAQHSVYPLITGTFGGVDFLHSVMGEFDDKATQSEIATLEGTMQESGQEDTSMIKELLSKIPSGIFGGDDKAEKADELKANAAAAQMQQMHVSPKEPEAFTEEMQRMSREIYPILEWHDEIMLSITEAIEEIPVLPELIEQIQDQINIFVFSLLAPFVLPIIEQIKTELNEGSSEIIASSKDKQLNVFSDDDSTDPTHSMLSKDHFSNILNEPAGKIASQVLKWVVPQLIQCWDDERIDPNRTIDRIINGVFHHPALREQGEDGAADGRRLMFGVVEQWWNEKQDDEKDEFRQKLSRDGVENGQNHKEGVQDTGHGCCKPLGMPKQSFSSSGGGGLMGQVSSALSGGDGGDSSNQIGQFAEEAVGGGALGGIVGAIAGGVGANLLGSVFNNSKKEESESEQYGQDGSYTQSYTETGRNQNTYAQARYEKTEYPSGEERTEYQRYEQSSGRDGTQGYGYEERTDRRPTYGGGYELQNERIIERPDGEVETEEWREGRDAEGRHYHELEHHKSRHSSDSGSENHWEKKHHGRERRRSNSGSGSNDSDRPQPYEPPSGFEAPEGPPPGRYGGGDDFGGGRGGYGREREFEEPRREEYGGGRGGYGQEREFEEPRREEYGGGRGGYGQEREFEEQYGERREERREGGGGWFN